MDPRRGLAAGGQDEAAQWLEPLVQRVDRAFQPGGLGGHDAQHHLGRREILARRGEVGAEVEQVILDAGEDARVAGAGQRGHGQADRAIGLVHRADRFHPRRVLGRARTVDQPGGAVVAGAGVDLVELDQRLSD